MLNLLQELVEALSLSVDLTEAFSHVTARVRRALDADACSIYVLHNKSYVLMATDGLNPDARYRVHMGLQDSLVGLVAKKAQRVHIEDITEHTKHRAHPLLSDTALKSFLGVPIIHQRQVVGVITLRQEEPLCFEEMEEAFLVTLAAQLAGTIAYAETTGKIKSLLSKSKGTKDKDFFVKGIAASEGIAMGVGVAVFPMANLDTVSEKETFDEAEEIQELQSALEAARRDVKDLSEKMAERLPAEEQALFDVYANILGQGGLEREVIETIQDKGLCAQAAWASVIKQHAKQFQALEDIYLRERADDLLDLGRRVLGYLQKQARATFDYPEETILVGEHITASVLAEVPEGRLRGIVSSTGSQNAHVAILARALGVPAIMGAEGARPNRLDGLPLVLDGFSGKLYVDPVDALKDEFLRWVEQEKEQAEELKALKEKPAKTLDDHVLSLNVNAGLLSDFSQALMVGSDGVGLYRTEIPFISRDHFPTEKEQVKIYTQLLSAFAPKPVVMRTLDVGGDKQLPYFKIDDPNPFLGWRGVRFTLDNPDIFLMQMRAMLLAHHAHGNLKILLPMITSVEEVEETLKLIRRAHLSVCEETEVFALPDLGVMLEVPSAIYQMEELAKHVDFFSVGTNDLTQYILATDRENAKVSRLYDVLHPAVLRVLKLISETASRLEKPVSVCGEIASDAKVVLALMGLGFSKFSMNANMVLKTKRLIRHLQLSDVTQCVSEAIALGSVSDIRAHLDTFLEQVQGL